VNAPFGTDSRTGYELELVAPRGRGRLDFARALAERTGGAVRYGFKYQSPGRARSGKPICDLTPAYRVLDDSGQVMCTLVDDVTIKEGLERGAATGEGLYRVVLDDLRMALWAERHCWAESPEPASTLAHLLRTFDGELLPRGEEPARHPDHRAAIDPYGHPLAIVALYPHERERVCEVVTRPLTRDERAERLAAILEVARALEFVVPTEAALHLHLDNGPWRSHARLRQLILDFSAARPLLWEELQPNPACTRLGPLHEKIVEAARENDGAPDDASFRRALRSVGPTKYADINITGLTHDRPRHPTLEFRCLPMSLDTERVLSLTDQVEGFLREVAETADARS
jgi:hypothetical protein